MLDRTAITEPIAREVYDYWDAKRCGRSMPARKDLDPPMDIPGTLPHLVLVDVIEARPRRFRYRLFGSKIVQYYGKDYTGCYADEILRGDFRQTVLDYFQQACEEKCPRYVVLKGTWSTVSRYSRLSLPLSNDDTNVHMLLVCIVASFDSANPKSYEDIVQNQTFQSGASSGAL